ncbi:MAG: transposase [Saprospiraceae bacterium]
MVAWRGILVTSDATMARIYLQLPQAMGKDNGVEICYIQLGKPSQNGLVERLNKTLRLECIDLHSFNSMEELHDSIQEWSVTYNNMRPHENLGYLSPNKFEELNKKLYFCMVAS